MLLFFFSPLELLFPAAGSAVRRFMAPNRVFFLNMPCFPTCLNYNEKLKLYATRFQTALPLPAANP
jgi:hypothetical protein